MIKIYIQGIKDGVYDVEQEIPVSDVPEIYPEFFGNISLKGKLRKFADRYTFTGTAECSANFICDISATEYSDVVTAEINTSYLMDSKQRNNKHSDAENPEEGVKLIAEEDKFIDLSDDVREELAVNIPMKKVAPQFSDKSFEEIFPEYSADSKVKNDIDDRWSILNKLKIN
jgi:uncharacterized metal-binding protein YceD (DUF177 family)